MSSSLRVFHDLPNNMVDVHRWFSENYPHVRSPMLKVAYASSENFTGRVVPGYHAAKILLTQQAAEAIVAIQQEALKQQLSLCLFDGYRPHKAVVHFAKWAEDNLSSPLTASEEATQKSIYYPRLLKQQIIEKKYLAIPSSHSRGSTIDLSLADLTGRLLDMGGIFDLFDALSHRFASNISQQAKRYRQLLSDLMEKAGFSGVDNEWWHFTLNNEPYPHCLFDGDIL